MARYRNLVFKGGGVRGVAYLGALKYLYEHRFMRTIERVVGRERFDAWLTGYFDRNAFRPMTTEQFLADIRTPFAEAAR